jgi:hypothetical protein
VKRRGERDAPRPPRARRPAKAKARPAAAKSPPGERIDVDDPASLRRWSRTLGVSEQTLERAIAAVGSASAVRVREFLETSGMR